MVFGNHSIFVLRFSIGKAAVVMQWPFFRFLISDGWETFLYG